MVPFEVQSRGGEISLHFVERRKAPGGILIRSWKTDAYLGLELRARAVTIGRYRATLLPCRVEWHVEMLSTRGSFLCKRSTAE